MAAGEGGHLPGEASWSGGFPNCWGPWEVGVWIQALGGLGQVASAPSCCAQSGPSESLGPLASWWQGRPGGDRSKLGKVLHLPSTLVPAGPFPILLPAWQRAEPVPKGAERCLPVLLAQHTHGETRGQREPVPQVRSPAGTLGGDSGAWLTTGEGRWKPCPRLRAGCPAGRLVSALWQPLGRLLCQLPTSVSPGQGHSPFCLGAFVPTDL